MHMDYYFLFFLPPKPLSQERLCDFFFFSNQGDLGLHTHGLFLFFLPPKPLSQERLCDFFFFKSRRPRTTYTWIFFFFFCPQSLSVRRDCVIFFFFKPRRHRTTWTYIYNRLTCGRAACRAGAAAADEGRALLWYSPEFVRTLNMPSCWALDAVLYRIMD